VDALDDGLVVVHHVEHQDPGVGNPLVELHHHRRSVLSRRGEIKQEDMHSSKRLLQDVAGTAKRSHHADARLTREEVPGFLSDEPTRVHNANWRGFGQGFAPNPTFD
jgi:hypothetical protein